MGVLSEGPLAKRKFAAAGRRRDIPHPGLIHAGSWIPSHGADRLAVRAETEPPNVVGIAENVADFVLRCDVPYFDGRPRSDGQQPAVRRKPNRRRRIRTTREGMKFLA